MAYKIKLNNLPKFTKEQIEYITSVLNERLNEPESKTDIEFNKEYELFLDRQIASFSRGITGMGKDMHYTIFTKEEARNIWPVEYYEDFKKQIKEAKCKICWTK